MNSKKNCCLHQHHQHHNIRPDHITTTTTTITIHSLDHHHSHCDYNVAEFDDGEGGSDENVENDGDVVDIYIL